ncbi:far upstream element-binding protein 1-like [Cucurbita maxima]|uniref:Far upstream element-binding protein 1-like n=1 Tax=Cucurbita maxima TaxID=3661 RepID=A0A6J1KKK3_CUCMA|nr:far upstream element-binding protein 1-like [Cucurbita maxima]
MADEAQYSSGTDAASNKRKYDDHPPPMVSRRPTGFSGPITSPSSDSANPAPPSYNNVPPPMDEIQLAKQRAQEIASRLIISSGGVGAGAGPGVGADAKRPRVENGGGFDSYEKGFSSGSDLKSHMSNSAPSATPVSYGFQGTSKKIDIPNGRVGVIIGKGGETIKYLQLQSGAKIQVTRDMDADPNSATRTVDLMGTPDQIAKAEQLINDVLSEAESGGSGIVSQRLTGSSGSEQFVMKIPNNKVGLVIGKGGETIKSMQARTGARIQVIPLHLPPGDTSTERTLQIDGSSEQIESAKQLVNEVTSENRVRNSGMSGGYQTRPPSSWGPPGAPPMQQPGYGYGQQGGYSGPSSQYNMQQPPYQGYSQPASGGYASNWDQSTVPPNQPATQGSGYDYYNQQPPQQQQTPGAPHGATGDNSGYSYGQPQASTYNQQGYSQDGYGGGYHAPQAGYSQPPTYDQQGYSSAPNYGNVANAAQDGINSYESQGDSSQTVPPAQPSSVSQQGYGVNQQPSPNPGSYPPPNQSGYGMTAPSHTGYGNQPAAQTGYGASYGPPQTQKQPANPPAYGQSTQSPSTPSGYGQPAALSSGYSSSQAPTSGYTQSDSGSQRVPPSSYGTAAQPGFAPPYGVPPTNQPGYGQAPPPYSSSYGAGYPQPPYSSDGNAGGAAAQSALQSGVAKASPKS